MVFSWLVISNSLPKFSRDVPRQQYRKGPTVGQPQFYRWAIVSSQYCTKSDSYIHLPSTFSYYSGIFWLLISNILLKFSRDIAMAFDLLYKSGHNSSHMHCICWWPRDRRFQIHYWNLQGRLPWQLNFGFHSQNCTQLAITPIICTIIPIICTILSFFCCYSGVFVVGDFKFVT